MYTFHSIIGQPPVNVKKMKNKFSAERQVFPEKTVDSLRGILIYYIIRGIRKEIHHGI